MALQVSPSASSKIRRARRAKSARTALPLACCRSSTISPSLKFILSSKQVIYYLFKRYGLLASGACSARASRPNRRAPGSAPELIAQRMRALLGGAYRSLETGADASAIHRLQRGMGGAAFGGNALAQQRRGLVRTAGPLCGARKKSHGQLVRLRLRQTHGAAGAGHGFEEVKHIGRARTRQGGDGVEQWLALHPQEFAGTG